MKHTGVKLTIIGVLSLFLLSKTPAADFSNSVESTSFDVISTASVNTISSPVKSNHPSLKEKIVKPVSTPVKTTKTASVSSNHDIISITGNNIALFNSTPDKFGNLPDAGNRVGVYNNRFYYGHNTANVLGKIENTLKIGSVFSVTKNGKTVKYQVKVTLRLSKPETQKIFGQIYNTKYNGVKYDISLMTCSGQALPGRDATHRFIIFASQV